MRRRSSRATVTLCNLASVALVLPGCALALYFLAVDYLARHAVGEWLDALATALDWLPAADYVPFAIIVPVVVAAALLCVMVWLVWFTPCLVLASGIASVAYIVWSVGAADVATNPLIWLSLIGMALGVWQLARFWSVEPGANLTRRA